MAQRVPAEYNAGTEWTSKSIMQGYTQTPTQSHEQLVLAGLHTCNDVQIWSQGVFAKHMLRYVALADSVVAIRLTELVCSLAQ